MKIAFIVPDAHLAVAKSSTCHMVLSTYYLKSRRYQDFYKKRKAAGDRILLDNSFHEYKWLRSDGWDVLLPIIFDLEPDVVVIPEEQYANEELLTENIYWASWVKKNILPDIEFMMAPRGNWIGEISNDIQLLRDLDPARHIQWIGIQKNLETIAKRNIGGRRAIVLGLDDQLDGYKIHMLGTYKDPVRELQSFSDLPNVYSCDTSKPWRICVLGRLVSEAAPYPPAFDFRQTVDEDTLQFIEGQLHSLVTRVENA